MTIILIVLILLLIVIIYMSLYKATVYFNTLPQKTTVFYNINDISPNLTQIHPLRNEIMKEVNTVLADPKNWENWPEKSLYDNKGEWKIFPLYAFGIWINDNCNKVPILTKFIKSIPNVQLATLSKLSPNMKLKPHRGWGSHSNHVLRAHYGLIIPDNCYVKVNDEIQYHQNDKWMVFDDSETHMAENQSDKDRLVLIIDISRPNHIPKGTSTIGDSKELLDIIDYFKQKQISM